MTRWTPYLLAAVAFIALASLGTTADAPVGPPWISVEMPANPLDPQTRDAAFVVHAYHHSRDADFPVAGTAEGLVDGERRSVELELSRTSRPGVFAVSQTWPDQGDWILVLQVQGRGEASLVMELGPDGGIGSEKYFNWSAPTISARTIRVVHGSVNASDLDSRLRSMAAATD